MADEYIKRQALLDAYDAAHKGPPGCARKLIAEAPAEDVAPVVRCKDCKNYRLFWNMFGVEISRCMLFGADVGMEAFCSYGERRGGV